MLPINHGVPQGSYILVPFLFLIYINGLNDTVNFAKIHHFATELRKRAPLCSCSKSCFGNFSKFTKKQLWWNLFPEKFHFYNLLMHFEKELCTVFFFFIATLINYKFHKFPVHGKLMEFSKSFPNHGSGEIFPLINGLKVH